MTEVSDAIWAKLRQAYEEGALPGVLARRWHLARRDIEDRAAREGWQRTLRGAVSDPADNGPPADGDRRSGPDCEADMARDAQAALCKRHQQAWDAVQHICTDALRACSDPTYQPSGAA